jgi:negative regulator of genetic competence, sporulation and motility
MLDSKRTMYSFESLSDLIQASKIISNTDRIEDSNLFYSESEGYYLEITERGASRLGEICEFAILLEFASKTPKERIPYITEHCKQLTNGSAVEKLAKL